MAEVDKVVAAFQQGVARDGGGRDHKKASVSTDGTYIYSYRLPIAGRGLDGVIEVLLGRQSPSITTSKHLGWFSYLAGRRVDALGCPQCAVCAGYHEAGDAQVCALNIRIREARAAVAEAATHGLRPTLWRRPDELRAAGLEVVLAPRYAPRVGAADRYVGALHCWVAPSIAAVIELASGAEVTRRQVVCALRLAAASEDYRAAFQVASEAGGAALAGFIRQSTQGVNLGSRHPSPDQLQLQGVCDA